MYSVNQIVKGKAAGTFVILAMRSVDGIKGAQVKPVNPANHAQHGKGEFWLPLSAITTIN